MSFFTSIVLALGIASAPVTSPPPQWYVVGSSADNIIEVDLNSFQKTVVNGGVEIFSVMRIIFLNGGKTFTIKGKEVLGAYSLSAVSAVCKEDKVVVHLSSLYDAKSNVLDTKKSVQVQNPHDGSFTSAYIDALCNDGKNTKPAPTI